MTEDELADYIGRRVLADQIHRLLSDEGSMPVPAIAARLKLEAAVVNPAERNWAAVLAAWRM